MYIPKFIFISLFNYNIYNTFFKYLKKYIVIRILSYKHILDSNHSKPKFGPFSQSKTTAKNKFVTKSPKQHHGLLSKLRGATIII